MTNLIGITFTAGRTDSGYQLVQNGIVIDIVDASGAHVDPASFSGYVVSNPNPANPSWFTPTPDPPIVPPLGPVPAQVTKLQLYLAAKQLGNWDTINAAINANADAAMEWSLTALVERHNPLVMAVAQAASWSDDSLDNLFRLAGQN